MAEREHTVSRSSRGFCTSSDAYRYMKARKVDAQRLFDKAVRNHASLDEALQYAGRQIRAALCAKRLYEAELQMERGMEEKPKRRRAPTRRKARVRQDEEEIAEEVGGSLAERLWCD